jgi:hypothetical protein
MAGASRPTGSDVKHSKLYDIRLTQGEAVVLFDLLRRLDDGAQLSDAEREVVTGMADLLDDALHASSGARR